MRCPRVWQSDAHADTFDIMRCSLVDRGQCDGNDPVKRRLVATRLFSDCGRRSRTWVGYLSKRAVSRVDRAGGGGVGFAVARDFSGPLDQGRGNQKWLISF